MLETILWKTIFTAYYCVELKTLNVVQGWKLSKIAAKDYGIACEPKHAVAAIVERT